MVFPEVLIWFENRHFLKLEDIEKARGSKTKLLNKTDTTSRISMHLGGSPSLGTVQFDGTKFSKGALLEIDNEFAIGAATFGKDCQWAHLTLFGE